MFRAYVCPHTHASPTSAHQSRHRSCHEFVPNRTSPLVILGFPTNTHPRLRARALLYCLFASAMFGHTPPDITNPPAPSHISGNPWSPALLSTNSQPYTYAHIDIKKEKLQSAPSQDTAAHIPPQGHLAAFAGRVICCTLIAHDMTRARSSQHAPLSPGIYSAA